MNLQNLWKEYSKVIIKTGVNLQENQILVVQAPIESREFVHVISETAYEMGAKEVIIRWSDEILIKQKFKYCSIETLQEIPQHFIDFYIDYKNKKAAFLSLVGEDPELLKKVDPKKIKSSIEAKSIALKEYYQSLMGDEISWNVAAVSIPSWAKAVFPELDEKEAQYRLWKEILDASRIEEENSVELWKTHIQNLKDHADYLNAMEFKRFHYTNKQGTDLTIDFPEGHIWRAGYGITKDGIEFVANIPTEEVYTLPHKKGINGIVYSSKPFNYAGNIIDEFYLKIKDGKIVEAKAKKGEEILNQLIHTDKGSMYFGEVALVPFDSPISNRNLLFYNTLFDENASCHLAIGKAYPTCLKDSEDKTVEELEELGVNDSIVHEDFMIGTKDLNIDGIRKNGEIIPVFRNGNWA
ncbi:MAG: aminopeptidase [Tissierellia bacterium]|nr:aminopeptidase [Tissierellia bacterium]